MASEGIPARGRYWPRGSRVLLCFNVKVTFWVDGKTNSFDAMQAHEYLRPRGDTLSPNTLNSTVDLQSFSFYRFPPFPSPHFPLFRRHSSGSTWARRYSRGCARLDRQCGLCNLWPQPQGRGQRQAAGRRGLKHRGTTSGSRSEVESPRVLRAPGACDSTLQ